LGDDMFGLSTAMLCDAHASSDGRTWRYEFAWRTPALGACHAADIPFTFDIVASPGWAWMLGDDPPQALADRIHGSLVEFAKTGDPGWDRYELPERRTMLFDEACNVVADPRGFERELWQRATAVLT
jgi:para-nitrobenzyl esterase